MVCDAMGECSPYLHVFNARQSTNHDDSLLLHPKCDVVHLPLRDNLSQLMRSQPAGQLSLVDQARSIVHHNPIRQSDLQKVQCGSRRFETVA